LSHNFKYKNLIEYKILYVILTRDTNIVMWYCRCHRSR